MIQKNLGLLSLILMLGASCSSIKFVSNDTIPVFHSDRLDHQTLYKIEGKKEAYFWGLVAPDNTIYLDTEFFNEGAKSIADVNVEVIQTRFDWISSVLSLGLYVPRHYKVVARGRR